MSVPRIVDVCGTLVMDDTTVGLLAWHFRCAGRWRWIGLQALTHPASPFRLMVALFERITRRHVLKHLLVRWLRGERVEALDKSAAQYADWLLANRRVHAVEAVLARGGGKLWLASASLQPIVGALAARLGATYVASTLASSAGCYAGTYDSDLTGRKLDALVAAGADLSGGYLAVSDNVTDRALLEQASKAYVVLHKPEHADRWTGLSAEYLPLC